MVTDPHPNDGTTWIITVTRTNDEGKQTFAGRHILDTEDEAHEFAEAIAAREHPGSTIELFQVVTTHQYTRKIVGTSNG